MVLSHCDVHTVSTGCPWKYWGSPHHSALYVLLLPLLLFWCAVSGNKGVNVLECSNCKADLSYDQKKRVIAVDRTPEDKAEQMAAAAAKKAAAAAKKAAAAARKAAAAGDNKA